MAKGIAARTGFDPADYSYVGSFYKGIEEEMYEVYAEDHKQLERKLGYELYESALLQGPCDSCGTGYAHGTVVEGPDGYLAVGHICGSEYFTARSIYTIRAREAKKLAERKANRAAGEAFVIAHDLGHIVEHNFTGDPVDHPKDGTFFEGWGGGVTFDILRKLFVYGSLSPAQIDLLNKIHEEHHERQAEVAEEEATLVAIPSAIVGVRSTIEATVLGTKVQESDYGPTLKMLVSVAHEGGVFKLWGTVPRSINGAKGDSVRFDAKVASSPDDEAFGFFSRPTKAETLNG